ncbi:MAG: PaaI family thioesterase [Firmicutes bacterium]|nr:PaaI family thioesterase [Bacillota bacterium]
MTEVTREQVIDFLNKFAGRNAKAPENYLIHMLTAECVDCSIEERWVDFEMVMPEEGINPIKSMHGGFLAAIADHIMCASAMAFINDENSSVTTIDLQLNTIKAMHAGEKIRMRCAIEHMGKRTSLLTCRFYRDGVLCAIASENLTKLPAGKVSYVDFENLK